jgi:hypothetical protein
MNIYGGGRLLNTYDRVQYRQINDDEIKPLFDKIKLNTDFSLPDKLIQDFINDGSIEPTFKKCLVFSNNDFDHIVLHIKKRKIVKKIPTKPGSKRKVNRKSKIRKSKKIRKNNKRIKKDKS